MCKESTVMRHRLHRLPMLGGMLQNLVARHDAALDFIEDDLPTKFDQRATFMAGNGTGMRLKEAEHFLIRGHLLALEHPAARLANDPLHQWQERLHLIEQMLGLLLGLLAQNRDDTPALLHHLLGGMDELLIQFLLLCLFVFSFAPQLPM